MAVAYLVRDRILARYMHTIHTYMESAVRAASYLSAEFLMGPQLATISSVLALKRHSAKPSRNWAWIWSC